MDFVCYLIWFHSKFYAKENNVVKREKNLEVGLVGRDISTAKLDTSFGKSKE